MDSVTMGCIALAERSSTPINEANVAAIKAFQRLRTQGVSLTELLENKAAAPIIASSSILLMEKLQLAAEVTDLRTKIAGVQGKLSGMQEKVASLSEKLAAAKNEVRELRETRKEKTEKPKATAVDGMIPFADLAHEATKAFGSSKWQTPLSILSGKSPTKFQIWRQKGFVPAEMLDYIPQLSTYVPDDRYSWADADHAEVIRFVKSFAVKPSNKKIAEHMSAFTGHTFNDNGMKGVISRLQRKGLLPR